MFLGVSLAEIGQPLPVDILLDLITMRPAVVNLLVTQARLRRRIAIVALVESLELLIRSMPDQHLLALVEVIQLVLWGWFGRKACVMRVGDD